MLPTSTLPRALRRLVTRYAYLWSIAITAIVTAGIWIIQRLLPLPQLSITPIYLVGVLLCAITVSRRPAILCAALSFVAFKFFFVEPIYSFTVDDAGDVSRMTIFLLTAVLGGGMGVWVREQAAAAQQRADESAALYALSQAISTELDFAAIAPVIVATTRRLLDSPACQLLLAQSDGSTLVCAWDGEWPAGAREAEAVLYAANRPLGRLRVALEVAEDRLRVDLQRLLETLANQAALALERSHLAQAAARAEALAQSDRLKSTLLSAVSHDFRTPLAAIIAAADELAADDVVWSPAATAEFAGVIRAEAQRLNRLVTNLLDLTRIEAGVLRPQRGWYNVAEIIYQVLQSRGSAIGDRRIELVFPDDLPLIPVDYIQIEQVVWNILENALKYAPGRSPITITVGVQETALVVGVGDRGPGIPPNERERVVEKFYRLPRERPDRVAGTGIGLAICKGLVEAHGGRLTISGREGGGTLVEVRLPLQEHVEPTSVGA